MNTANLSTENSRWRRQVHVFRVNSGKRVSDHLVGHSAQLLDERPCLCGNVKPPCSPVGGVSYALNQTRFFKSVDDPRQCDWFDVKHIGKLDLAKAGFALESK